MNSRSDAQIHFEGVTKRYGAMTVIDDLELTIQQGEFVSLLGPSGSGKTTLLMILAGFENPSEGKVWLDGRQIEHVPPYRRDMGVVFQNYALFPHMTAAQNIAFPLKRRGIPKAEIAEKVSRALDMVQLSSLGDRKPSQMSGGQQQRIALARALVFEPAVVLMDEPLGALDKQLREQMQLDIRALHMRLGLTIVFVTHDQSEALTMSDRIAVFNKGKIEQIDTPSGVYDRPSTRFVSEFIGETNLLHGTVQSAHSNETIVSLDGGQTIKAAAVRKWKPGQKVAVSVRPERVSLGQNCPTGANAMTAKMLDSVYQGDHVRVSVQAPIGELTLRLDRRAPSFAVGEIVQACFMPEDCWIIVP